MARIILVICVFLRIGKIIQYIPYTVTAGFTAGIGITILSTQIHDILGISLPDTSGNFIDRMIFIFNNISNSSLYAIILGTLVAVVVYSSEI